MLTGMDWELDPDPRIDVTAPEEPPPDEEDDDEPDGEDDDGE